MKFAAPIIAIISASGAHAFVQNSPVRTKISLNSYLDDIGPAPPAKVSSSGIGSYLDSVTTSTALHGAGIGSYLDSVNQACDTVATEECADAITDYMGALSTGDAPAESASEGAKAIGSHLDSLASQASVLGGAGIPSYLSTVATSPERAGGAGIDNYLDSVPSSSAVSSAPAVKSFLDALASGDTEAPAAPAVAEYISNVSAGATAAPTSGEGIASYLGTLPVTSTQVGGAGIPHYLSAVTTNPEVRGAGIGSYLDGISQACEASQPTSECAEAIVDYMDALSSGDAPAESSGTAAQSIGSYFDQLSSGSATLSGAGIPDYLSTVGGSSAIQGGSAAAVKTYLDVMSAGAIEAPSAPVVEEYLEDVSSGAASTPTSGAGIASYLTALTSATALSGGAGIASHVSTLASGNELSGGGVTSYLDSVGGAAPAPIADVPAVAAVAATPATAGEPSTQIDTQVSHDGLQTTITITSVTTVVIDDA